MSQRFPTCYLFDRHRPMDFVVPRLALHQSSPPGLHPKLVHQAPLMNPAPPACLGLRCGEKCSTDLQTALPARPAAKGVQVLESRALQRLRHIEKSDNSFSSV